MDEARFDALTRAIARSTSRRHTLKLVAAGALAGVGALFARRPSAAQQTRAPAAYLPALMVEAPPLRFEAASAAQLEPLAARADASAAVRAFKAQLTAARFTLKGREGLLALRGSNIQNQTLLLQYEGASAGNLAYLVFGVNQGDEQVVFVLRYDPAAGVVVGLYRDADGTVQVELEQRAPASAQGEGADAGDTSAQGPVPLRLAGTSEGCRVCGETCAETNKLQQSSCVVRTVGTAVNVAFTTRSILRSTVERAIETAGNIDGVRTGVNSIRACIERQDLDCSPSGPMCRSLCGGCAPGPGGGCTGISVCVGGDCRARCGGNICKVGETCGPGGRCIPVEEGCQGGTTYMGLYRFGNTQAPACCAIRGGLNCGAATTGIWGGCCPPGTVCFPLGIAYGCCIPGGTCNLF
ncbi:MAG TPA: hypothetical protein PKD53_16995 [Chloroflexaceae bacterium]|nr:hypothetical protein [Chloroflexaceae bacterium]